MNRIWFRSISILTAAVGVSVVAGCGGVTVPAANSARPHPASGFGQSMNTLTAQQLVNAITDAGLPVPGSHDVSGLRCPQVGCLDDIESDTISVMTFPSTGRAELYAGSIPDMFQIANVVVRFDASVPPGNRRSYETVLARTLE
ncbi:MULTISPECIES: hypothetical protein [Mycobacterium]|nr:MULTISPECIES: hypothetical protein [Mycobacterium]MCG7610483.1 hypothetical protein [Mycobacterium sp. CnD-18-1]